MPNQRFKMQFLATTVNSSRGVFRSVRTSKMKLFEKNIFSCPQFQLFTIYTKSFILDVPLHSEYTPETINYFWNRLHLDVLLGSIYTSDMFKERQKLQKPVKRLFLGTLQQKLEIISKKFPIKTLPRNDFLHSCFQQVL